MFSKFSQEPAWQVKNQPDGFLHFFILNPLAAEQERQVLASVTSQIFNSGTAAPGEIPGEKLLGRHGSLETRIQCICM